MGEFHKDGSCGGHIVFGLLESLRKNKKTREDN